jgi:hypothetical protein
LFFFLSQSSKRSRNYSNISEDKTINRRFVITDNQTRYQSAIRDKHMLQIVVNSIFCTTCFPSENTPRHGIDTITKKYDGTY